MDVAGLIASFSQGTYTVTRTTRSLPQYGVVADGTETTFTVTGAWHPARGRDLLRLPEARRTVESRMFYTATALLVGEQGGSYEADKVSIDGRDWEVEHVEQWNDKTTTQTGYVCIVQAVEG